MRSKTYRFQQIFKNRNTELLLLFSIVTPWTNVKYFQEHACSKIKLSEKTSLYTLCLYRSLNNISENNKLLNQLILNTSLVGGKLLTLGDFNFPAINWDSLSTEHLFNHCASEFLAATQDAFLFQYIQSPAHTRPNQKPTLIDLIFQQHDLTITNMTSSAPLGKSYHKILRFYYAVDNNSKIKDHVTYTVTLTMAV